MGNTLVEMLYLEKRNDPDGKNAKNSLDFISNSAKG